MISLYIAVNVEIISEHTSFIELIEGRGAFVRDLWKRVVPKMPVGEMTMLKLLQKFSFLCQSACRTVTCETGFPFALIIIDCADQGLLPIFG